MQEKLAGRSELLRDMLDVAVLHYYTPNWVIGTSMLHCCGVNVAGTDEVTTAFCGRGSAVNLIRSTTTVGGAFPAFRPPLRTPVAFFPFLPTPLALSQVTKAVKFIFLRPFVLNQCKNSACCLANLFRRHQGVCAEVSSFPA